MTSFLSIQPVVILTFNSKRVQVRPIHVTCTGVLISPYPDQEGNKIQRQKFLMFIYPIYCHNWRNISTVYIYIYIYIYITSLASNEIFLPSNKIHREVGLSKDLSAPLYKLLLKDPDLET